MSESAAEVKVDPTAVVHPSAELDSGVEIGPYCVIGEDVRIGRNTRLGPYVNIDRWTTIGENNEIFQYVSIAAPPQDLTYRGERTDVIIGDGNVIREFVTIHRATTKEAMRTVIGSNNFLMNYVHIAHDCAIGDHVIMANNATLGGHVTIDDHAIVGGLVAVHQFVRIGAYCIIGGASAVSKDVPPYVMAVGNRAHLYGLNSVGLRRAGFSRADISEIKRSYNILFRSSLKLADAMERLRAEMPDSLHAGRYLEFLKGSKRGVTRERLHRRPEHEEA
ncbi:MAG TPA: acyl-ACP--UDP-N-acetylglucosamine O-acyltransferase [Deltaproteobacteria bacterium]|nr:acyl-ACP--UDP-N-acetylglucosamine O-acyltransferase [Deltaproteobacteria bacterium]